MSDEKKSGLSAMNAMYEVPQEDIGKLNPYMLRSDPKLRDVANEYLGANEQYIKNLEDRFANPNWLKVSAAFAKPQLGGFGASFGSAMNELGSQEEARRSMLPTISQMRAANARGTLTLEQAAKAAATAEAAAKKGVITPGAAGDVAGLTSGPSAVPKAITEQESAAIQQFAQKLQSGNSIVTLRKDLGDEFVDKYLPMALQMFPNLKTLPNVQAVETVTPPVGGGGNTPLSSSDRAAADLAGINREIERLTKNPGSMTKEQQAGALAILNQEKQKIESGGNGVTPPVAQPQSQGGNYYPSSYQPPSQMPHGQSLEISKANAQKQIDKANAPAQKKFAVASMFDPQGTSYMQATAATEGALQGIYSNPAAFTRVTNLVNKAGGLAAVVNAGVGVHLGPYGAKIDIPVSAYKQANLSPEDQEFANMLANKVATNAYYGLLARGINPENQGTEKFNTLLLQETHLGQTARAIEHSLKMNKSYFDHQAKQFEIVNNELASGKANPNSPTKLADIYNNSPELKALQLRQAAIHRALNKEAFTPPKAP
jgi:hypothetical protein